MRQEELVAYEVDCIRRAAGRPGALVRPVERSEGMRSRTYLLEGPGGGSFVKCLDAGYHNPLTFCLTLEHEAAGYRFFACLDDGLVGVPEVHFYQAFAGPSGEELQVLGLTNLRATGDSCLAREIYLDPDRPMARKESLAALCGRSIARLVSPAFQAGLDRAAGIAAIWEQTDRVINHPEQERLIAALENHQALPWAYQNQVLGEMNVLVPAWLRAAGRGASAQVADRLALVGRVLTSPELVAALSPGQSGDRIVFSPHDRHDGNTMLVLEEGVVKRLYEIDMEFWGLETIGRMIGRYASIQSASLRHNPSCWQDRGPTARNTLLTHYHCLTGAFLYHFIRGDGAPSADATTRALAVGLAGYHAVVFWLYVAALFPPGTPAFLEDACHFLNAPGTLLQLAADYAESQPAVEAELVLEAVGQVWIALQPLVDLSAGLMVS